MLDRLHTHGPPCGAHGPALSPAHPLQPLPPWTMGQTEEPTKNFNKNVSDDLVFYTLGDTFKVDKEFAVPTVLRYFFTPEGARVQLMHINQANAESDTKTLWFQNDKYQEKDTKKKSQSSPQAKQEEAKPEARTL